MFEVAGEKLGKGEAGVLKIASERDEEAEDKVRCIAISAPGTCKEEWRRRWADKGVIGAAPRMGLAVALFPALLVVR